MKLTQAQYSQIAPYWDAFEQEGATFNAAALFARWPDCFVSRLPNNTPVAALLGRVQAGLQNESQVWWVHQWVTNKTQTAILQARHTARAMAEGCNFYIPKGITIAYGAVPDLRTNGRGKVWADSLLAAGVVEVVKTQSILTYKVYLQAYLTQMQARS